MTTAPTYTALRDYQRTTAALLEDPDITGDLLLVGLWLARATILNQPDREESGGWNLIHCARDLYPLTRPRQHTFNGEAEPAQNPAPDGWKVVDIVKKDIRRYDPLHGHTDYGLRGVCAGPMVRRATCGKPSRTWRLLTDPATGQRHPLAACWKHIDWFEAQVAANREALKTAEVPIPAANTGGHLARHLTDIDWPVLWKALDPEWIAPPEQEPAPAKPKLRLIITGILDPEPSDARPALTVVDGGPQ